MSCNIAFSDFRVDFFILKVIDILANLCEVDESTFCFRQFYTMFDIFLIDGVLPRLYLFELVGPRFQISFFLVHITNLIIFNLFAKWTPPLLLHSSNKTTCTFFLHSFPLHSRTPLCLFLVWKRHATCCTFFSSTWHFRFFCRKFHHKNYFATCYADFTAVVPQRSEVHSTLRPATKGYIYS